MLNLGTVRPGSTIRIPFSTFDKDDGSSITMTNFAVADILVYKDGSTTERASTSGFTATTDFDGKTGKHLIVLDLADNTTADFWKAGSEYLVAVDAVTVDSVSTGGWVGRFVIGYANANLDTSIASLSTQTSFTLTVGPAEDDALNGMYAIVHDAASAVQRATVLISDYTGSTKTVTLAAAPTFTIAAGDNFSVIDLAPLQPTVLGRTLDVSSGGEAGLDWANIGSPTTAQNLSATNIDVDQVVASVSGAVGSVTGAVGSVTGNVGGNVTGSVGSVATGGITAGSIAADAIGASELAADAASEIAAAVWAEATRTLTALDEDTTTLDLDATIRGAVGLASANLDTQIGTLATAANLATVAGYVDTEVASIKAVTDKLDTTLEATSDGYAFTANALENAPTGSGSGLDAAGVRAAIGLASANLDTQLSGIQSDTNDIQSRLPAALVSGRMDSSVGAMAANTLTASALATDAVTEIQSGLSTLDAAGVRTAVGLASANLDTQLDALPTASENASAVWGAGTRTLTAIDEDDTTIDLDATIRGAIGLAAANLDTQIGTLATASALATVDGVVDAILVDTAEIGAAGAGLTALASAANLATVAGYIDTEVAAIKATTDKLDTLVEATSDGYHLSANAIDEIPDAVWREPIANHTGVSGSTAEALNAAGSAGDPWTTALPGAYSAGQAGYILGTNLDATVSSRASQTSLNAVDDYVDTEVGAIKAVTDKIDGMLIATSDGYAYTGDALENSPAGSGGLDAAGVRAAIGLASANLDTQLGTIDTVVDAIKAKTDNLPTDPADQSALEAILGTPVGASLSADIAAVQSDTNDIQSRIPAALISGRIDATVGAMQANVMTAAAAASDLTTELQTGLATAANLATLTGYVDTEVASIKSVTDKVDAMLEATSDGWMFTVDALQQGPTGTAPTAGEVADAVWDEAVDGATTARQSMRVQNSVLAGKVSAMDSFAPVFRDLADTKNRVSATVDEFGNRSAITLDAS